MSPASLTPAYRLNLKSAGLKRLVGGSSPPLGTNTKTIYPFVFDLLIVRRCALRLCFFLASRASAYLFIAVGEADFFSAFALVSGTALGSELTTGVVLIISSPSNFFTGMPTFWLRLIFQISEASLYRKHSVHRTMVGQFSDDQPVLVRTSGNPRTTAHTLRLNERFIRGNDEMHELDRGHEQSILPLRN